MLLINILTYHAYIQPATWNLVQMEEPATIGSMLPDITAGAWKVSLASTVLMCSLKQPQVSSHKSCAVKGCNAMPLILITRFSSVHVIVI